MLRVSSVSGAPRLSFIRENEGQRSIFGGSVFMGGHWKDLVRVTIRAGAGWPSCNGILKCQDAGAPSTTLAASVLEMRFP